MEFEKEQVWHRLADVGDYETYYPNATESERTAFRQWVKGLMWEQAILVEFVKADGTVRTMKCTLSDLYGAKYPDKTTSLSENAKTKTRQPNEHVCSVWDVDKSAWRSFRWDRLKRIDFKIG